MREGGKEEALKHKTMILWGFMRVVLGLYLTDVSLVLTR